MLLTINAVEQDLLEMMKSFRAGRSVSIVVIQILSTLHSTLHITVMILGKLETRSKMMSGIGHSSVFLDFSIILTTVKHFAQMI